MIAADVRVGMSLEDYLREFDEQPFELINGEKRLIMPNISDHSVIIKILFGLLFFYEQKFRDGLVFSESSFVLLDTPTWVKGSRVPDVFWYTRPRWEAFVNDVPNWRKRPFTLVPDLCIEVISPNDKYVEVDEKVQQYFADGVRRVWVANPRGQYLTVYTSANDQGVRLSGTSLLQDSVILPNFSVPVELLFEDEVPDLSSLF